MKLTYTPLKDLHQNILKEKIQARKLRLSVHLSIIMKKTHKSVITIRLVLAELQSPDCFLDL